jgi:hypothetical protein
MQPKWIVIVRAREFGEFPSRHAAMMFAERVSSKEGPYSVVRRPLERSPRKRSVIGCPRCRQPNQRLNPPEFVGKLASAFPFANGTSKGYDPTTAPVHAGSH